MLNHGGTEMGQGLFIKVAQVVAEVFAIDLDHVRVSATSTAKVPNTSPTAASSGSDLNGMAALHASEQIKARMTEVAAEHFAVPAHEIVFSSNRIYAGNRSLSFGGARGTVVGDARVAVGGGFLSYAQDSLGLRHQYRASVLSTSPTVPPPPKWRSIRSPANRGSCAPSSSRTVGRSLNPAIDLGQIEGGFIQGMGWLTTEELWWDAEGRLRTHGPSTYKIPGSRDVPPIFNARILNDAPNREATIFRSKAVGEPPLMLAISVMARDPRCDCKPCRLSSGAGPRCASHPGARACRDRRPAQPHAELARSPR